METGKIRSPFIRILGYPLPIFDSVYGKLAIVGKKADPSIHRTTTKHLLFYDQIFRIRPLWETAPSRGAGEQLLYTQSRVKRGLAKTLNLAPPSTVPGTSPANTPYNSFQQFSPLVQDAAESAPIFTPVFSPAFSLGSLSALYR